MKAYLKLLNQFKVGRWIFLCILLDMLFTVGYTQTVKEFQLVLQDITDVRQIVIFLCLIASTKVLSAITFKLSKTIEQRFEYLYSNELESRILRMPMEKLQKLSIGEASTALNGVKNVADNIYEIPSWIFQVATWFTYSIVLMYQEDVVLSTIIVTEAFLVGSFVFHFKRKISKMNKEIREIHRRQASLIDRINGFLTIRAFANESSEERLFDKVARKNRRVREKKVNLVNIMWGGVMSTDVIFNATILVYAYIMYRNGTFDITQIMLFHMLSGSIISPFCQLPNMMDAVTEFKVNLDKNQKIYEMGVEYDGTIELKNFEDSIEFKHVGFNYENSDEILQDITLKIPKGSKVGIYGPSGAGKSTLVNLLMRFFQVSNGEILIDGVNINEFTNTSLRRTIGIVNNRAAIFSDMTIKENIAYGNPGCTETQIVEAARKANAHDFIMDLPKGYDSLVGNNGVELSDGQGQRITIARLFLLNPDIIIMDEATSKLDNKTEILIKKAIDELSREKTVISIAHRFTTIENSDYLIGIKNHRICEMGTKEEIDKEGTLFYSLKHQGELD